MSSSSVARPTNTRPSPPTPRGRISVSARTRRRQTRPPGLPFASIVRGSSNSKAPRTIAAVRSPTRISPGAAACSSLAPTFTASPVTNELPSRGLAHDDFAGVDSDPERQPATEQLSQCASHCEGCVQRPFGVVLLRCGRAEGSHHRVADELLHGAAGPLDLSRHRLVEAVEHRPGALGIQGICQRSRAHEIGEEHRHELALLARRGGLGRRGADRTEARVSGKVGAALCARRHLRADCHARAVRDPKRPTTETIEGRRSVEQHDGHATPRDRGIPGAQP